MPPCICRQGRGLDLGHFHKVFINTAPFYDFVGNAFCAVHALPLERHGLEFIDVRATAAWAGDAIGPTARDEIDLASLIIRKHRLELGDGSSISNRRPTTNTPC